MKCKLIKCKFQKLKTSMVNSEGFTSIGCLSHFTKDVNTDI